MKHRVFFISLVTVLVLGIAVSSFAANYTMSWDFQIFGNPNARQVALNIAEAQRSLQEDEDDLTKEFERMINREMLYRLADKVIRMAYDKDEFKEIEDYPVGNYLINVMRSEDGESILVVFEDTTTGQKTTIEVGKKNWQGTGYYYPGLD